MAHAPMARSSVVALACRKPFFRLIWWAVGTEPRSASATRQDHGMADDKKTKTKEKKEKPEAKADVAAKPAETKPDAPAEAKPDAKADAPKNYSRGEGQKAVTQAYKDNWNAIFGKKKR